MIHRENCRHKKLIHGIIVSRPCTEFAQTIDIDINMTHFIYSALRFT